MTQWLALGAESARRIYLVLIKNAQEFVRRMAANECLAKLDTPFLRLMVARSQGSKLKGTLKKWINNAFHLLQETRNLGCCILSPQLLH